MGHIGILELSIVSFLALFYLLPVVAFWKICTQIGFNGALGFLTLVPIANIILPLYVAFASWPAFKSNSGRDSRI
jgi:hypothetical protein